MPIRSVRSHPLALTVAMAGLVTAIPPAHAADPSRPAAPTPAVSAPVAQPVAPAPAGQPTVPPADLDSRVRELEETVRELRETIRQLQESAKQQGKPPLDAAEVQKVVDERLKGQKPTAGYQDGFYIQSSDGDFRLHVGGYLQASSRWFPSNGGDTGPNSFYLRRARPLLEGTVYKNIGFRLMPDFGLGTTVLQDAYLDLKFWPQAQLRLGKFKEPLSLERLQSGSDLLFIERSIANYLAPNRDVGAQLYGDLARGTVGYAFGVFNGVNDGASSDGDAEDSKDIAARLFFQPFKNQAGSPAQGLGFGVAGTLGRQRDPLTNVTYRTAGRSTFFKYDPAAVGAGDHRRVAPQLYYYQGPVGLLGEYIISNQGVRKGTTRADLTNHAWFLQGSYVLTGEKAGYRNVSPARPFDPQRHQWGAFELAARYSQVDVDQDAFRRGLADPATSASRARAYTLGLNWYLNRAVKAQFNWEETNFDRSIRFGTDRRHHEDVFLTQLQVAF